jgi:hypothetical protein
MPSSKFEANKTWQLVEQHGLWWACQGDMPPPGRFGPTVAPITCRYLDPIPLARLQRTSCG